MTRLLLARHAAATGEAGRYWGRTDHPLSEAGREQALRLASRLEGAPLEMACSSDLTRATETATLALGRRDLPVDLHPDLRELDFGACEGLTYAEALRLHPETGGFWSGDDPLASPPGGESLGALVVRVDRFLVTVRARGREASILVVSHAGPLRVLLCRCLGVDPRRYWQFRVDHASLSVLDLQPDCAILESLNDVCHLH
jgi:broad specificity phosphatase PhoE